MPFQDIGLVVAFILEHYKMVISKNVGVENIREFFAQRDMVDVDLPENIVKELEKHHKTICFNGKIINTAVATAMSSGDEPEAYGEAVQHAFKGLHILLKNIWIPAISNSLLDNKQTQHIEYKVKLDKMTSLTFEAYVSSFSCGFVIILGVGVAFNESFAKADHLIYYPTILFHGKDGVSDEETDVGRGRLDKIYETMDSEDLLGVFAAFEKVMKVSTYS